LRRRVILYSDSTHTAELARQLDDLGVDYEVGEPTNVLIQQGANHPAGEVDGIFLAHQEFLGWLSRIKGEI
jgi:hypothetical protein